MRIRMWLIYALLMFFLVAGCSSTKSKYVGTWKGFGQSAVLLVLNKDGTGTISGGFEAEHGEK